MSKSCIYSILHHFGITYITTYWECFKPEFLFQHFSNLFNFPFTTSNRNNITSLISQSTSHLHTKSCRTTCNQGYSTCEIKIILLHLVFTFVNS